MHKNHSSGFTLIELLVVIGIIGILSAVVLASLNTARFKGNDAAIQSDLAAVQTQAEIYYGGTGGNSYGTQAFSVDETVCSSTGTGMFTDATIKKAIDGAFKAGGSAAGSVACVAAGTTYAIASKLTATAGEWWCVDSTGSAKKETSAFPAATFSC